MKLKDLIETNKECLEYEVVRFRDYADSIDINLKKNEQH